MIERQNSLAISKAGPELVCLALTAVTALSALTAELIALKSASTLMGLGSSSDCPSDEGGGV